MALGVLLPSQGSEQAEKKQKHWFRCLSSVRGNSTSTSLALRTKYLGPLALHSFRPRAFVSMHKQVCFASKPKQSEVSV